jgi:hypothetical protein
MEGIHVEEVFSAVSAILGEQSNISHG